MPPRSWFIVPAAGKSLRMGAVLPKQYLELAGRTVLEHALMPLLGLGQLAGGVVVLAADDATFARTSLAAEARLRTCIGGAERADSVAAGLASLAIIADPTDWVLVHDAARPCLDPADLRRLIEVCHDDAVGGLLATPLADTLKRVDDEGRIVATVERARLWRALTPQMFRLGRLQEALAACRRDGVAPTDEAAAIEHLGLRPRLVAGSPDNIKITGPADVEVARRWLAARGEHT